METLSRRTFLDKGLKAAVFLAVLDPFKKCFGSSSFEIQYPSWKDLVEDARWCPSVHNLQPHKLKIISETEAELYYDPKRLLPIGDPECVFTTVAMGIFVEHLSIVASHYGCEVNFTTIEERITTKANGLTLFARLKMQARTNAEIFNRDLIKKRRTSRGHYDHKFISEETLKGLKKITGEHDQEFFYSQEESLVEEIIKLNQETLFEDLDSKETCKELDSLFRYNEEEAEKNKDGLWNRCMGFPGSLMKRVFTHHQSWTHGAKRTLLGKYYRSSFKGTRTLCWFGGSFSNTNDWLNCGKMLARNWLFITSQGAYIQPFGSLITNAGAYKKINEKFTQPSHGRSIWMIFRVGYSKEPTRSFRLSTEDIII